MYHISFFIDYNSLLEQKLNSFLKNKLSDVWIYNGQQDSQLQSLDNLPTHSGYWYSQPWYIHGPSLNKSDIQNFPGLPIYTGSKYQSSFEEIDATLNWLATNYLWSVFPWGGAKRFLSFGFLSRKRHLRDQFINASSTVLNRVEKFNITHSCNMLVSSYDVTTELCKLIQAILFSGYHKPAYRLWDVCNCDVTPPWLITDLFDEDIFSIFSWEPAEYKFIQSLAVSTGNNRRLGVYQPLDKKSFESMCMLSTQEPDTLIFVPQGTNLEKLQFLLVKTEDYNSYSDLIHVQNILSVTNWCYGVDRDRVDYGHSLFIARENALIQDFNHLDINDDYCLISCF